MSRQKIDQILEALNQNEHAVGILSSFNRLAEEDNLSKEEYGRMLGGLVLKLVNIFPEANEIYFSAE